MGLGAKYQFRNYKSFRSRERRRCRYKTSSTAATANRTIVETDILFPLAPARPGAVR